MDKRIDLTPFRKRVLELESYTIEKLNEHHSLAASKKIKENGKRAAKTIRAYISSIINARKSLK